MSEHLRASLAHWEDRFLEASEAMCEIRRAIHNQRMAHCPMSNEFAVLNHAYNQADAIINQFHNGGTDANHDSSELPVCDRPQDVQTARLTQEPNHRGGEGFRGGDVASAPPTASVEAESRAYQLAKVE